MVVELDVFSGRPNPRWPLDDRSTARLMRLHEALRRDNRVVAEPPGLGYRGFLYTEGSTTWRAYRGIIRSLRVVLADPDLQIERFLLASIPSEHNNLRQRLAREIGG